MRYKTTRMYDYISETPKVLDYIIINRKSISSNFVVKYKDTNIEQIYIIGSGTSYHAGVAVKAFLEEVLNIKVIVQYPIIFKDQEKVFNKETLVIGVSQGGQSFSTVFGLDSAREKGLYTAALSANKEARIFKYADISVDLAVGEELCGAKTKGYSGTICTLIILGLELSFAKGIITTSKYEEYLSRMHKVINNLPKVIKSATEWYYRICRTLLPVQRVIVIGYDANYANALEGSLKILETIRQAVSGYELEEFIHGIYNSINPDCHIFYIGSEGEYKQRALLLKETMQQMTPHHYFIGSPVGFANPTEKDLVVDFIDDCFFSVWEYIQPLQIVAALASIDLGINPDIPADPEFHQKMRSK